MKDLNAADELSFLELQECNNISDEYHDLYVELYLKTIDRLDSMDCSEEKKIINYTANLFDHFNSRTIHGLSERVIRKIVKTFLFHSNLKIAEKAANFTLKWYLFKAEDKLDERLEVFKEILTGKVVNIMLLVQEEKPRQNEEERGSLRMAIRNFVNFVVSMRPFSYEEDAIINSIQKLLRVDIV